MSLLPEKLHKLVAGGCSPPPPPHPPARTPSVTEKELFMIIKLDVAGSAVSIHLLKYYFPLETSQSVMS